MFAHRRERNTNNEEDNMSRMGFTWKSELEKRVAIIEEYQKICADNTDMEAQKPYNLDAFQQRPEILSILRDMAALVPADHRVDPVYYAEDLCTPLYKRYRELGWGDKNKLEIVSDRLQRLLEEYVSELDNEKQFHKEHNSDKMLPLWNLFKRSIREGTIRTQVDMFKPAKLGENPTKKQYDHLMKYDKDNELFIAIYSWESDDFKTKEKWYKRMSKAKYNQGQTVYFKTNAPIRKGRGWWSDRNISDVEKAERKLLEEKNAGTLTNKPALIIEVPDIVPEGDYQGNRLYKVMLPGYPAPVCLPERCFKKSTSTKGRKKNKSNLTA